MPAWLAPVLVFCWFSQMSAGAVPCPHLGPLPGSSGAAARGPSPALHVASSTRKAPQEGVVRERQSQSEDPGGCGDWAVEGVQSEQGDARGILSLSSREASLRRRPRGSELCKAAEEREGQGDVGYVWGQRCRGLLWGEGAHTRGCRSQTLPLLPAVVRNIVTEVPGPCSMDDLAGCALSALLPPRRGKTR